MNTDNINNLSPQPSPLLNEHHMIEMDFLPTENANTGLKRKVVEKPPRKSSNPTKGSGHLAESDVEKLSAAVARRDVEEVKRVLAGLSGISASWLLNNAAVNGKPILNYAAATGQLEMVKYLLDNGINPCLINVAEKIPTATAADAMKNGTALHDAIRSGQFEVACVILGYNTSNIDYPAGNSSSISQQRKMSIARQPDEDGQSPLITLAGTTQTTFDMTQFTTLVRLLCEMGCDPNERNPVTGRTVLYEAVERQAKLACSHLIAAGALVDVRDTQLNTPLHIAAQRDLPNIIQLFLDQSQESVNAQNENGNTPLHEAAIRGYRECVNVLLSNGADLSTKNLDSDTALEVIFTCIPRPCHFLLDTLNSKVSPNEFGINDRRFQLKLDFRVLAPNNKEQMSVVIAMMKYLRNPDRRRVLGHPLIETFLRAKWLRLRIFFFAMCILHCIFVFSLSAHVAFTVANHTYVTWSRRILLVTAALFTIHIVDQTLLAPRYFLKSSETWLSITCILLSFIIAITGELRVFGTGIGKDDEEWTRHVAAYAVLFAWGQLLSVLGRFPTFGVIALMFFTVLKNVIKVLLIWMCLVFGFALSFYIQNRTLVLEGIVATVVRTSVMIMGEYQYDQFFPRPSPTLTSRTDISQLPTQPPRWQERADNLGETTQIVFLLFIFLGSIVLVNLMIGLAVSDIQGLRHEGNLRHIIKQAEFLLHMDSLFARFQLFQVRKTIPTTVAISPNRGRVMTEREFRRLWLSIPSSVMDGLVTIALTNINRGSEVGQGMDTGTGNINLSRSRRLRASCQNLTCHDCDTAAKEDLLCCYSSKSATQT